MDIRFVIPGRLRGKGRPRFVRASGRTYTDAKTASMEAVVRQIAALAMAGKSPMEGPLRLSVAMRINHPASWSKKKKAGAVYVTGKPDCDNCIKIFDACNGILWRDDSQIAEIDFTRRYSDGPEESSVIVAQLGRVE